MARNRFRASSRARPKTQWGIINDTPTTIAGSSAVLLFSGNAAFLAARPFTILRTHVLLHYFSDQSAASETYQAAFGMGVATEAAVAAGVASVPTPISEPEATWFVYEPLFGTFDLADATGFNEPSGYLARVDSKAKRKVTVNDDVYGAIEVQSAEGMLIGAQGRFLIQLH